MWLIALVLLVAIGYKIILVTWKPKRVVALSTTREASSSDASPNERLKRASTLLEEGNDKAAAEILERLKDSSAILTSEALRARVLGLQGLIEMRRADPMGASLSFMRAVKAAPAELSLYADWADAMRAAGEPEVSAAILLKALRKKPTDFYLTVKYHLALLETEEAAAVEKKVAEEANQSAPAVLVIKAAIACKNADLTGARELLEKAKVDVAENVFAKLFSDPAFARLH